MIVVVRWMQIVLVGCVKGGGGVACLSIEFYRADCAGVGSLLAGGRCCVYCIEVAGGRCVPAQPVLSVSPVLSPSHQPLHPHPVTVDI